ISSEPRHHAALLGSDAMHGRQQQPQCRKGNRRPQVERPVWPATEAEASSGSVAAEPSPAPFQEIVERGNRCGPAALGRFAPGANGLVAGRRFIAAGTWGSTPWPLVVTEKGTP